MSDQTPLPHPTQDELLNFTEGLLDDEAMTVVQTHLKTCDACADEVAELKSAGVVIGLPIPERWR